VAKIVDSQALEPANKALGIAGSGDSQTEFTDGTLDQVLDMAPIVRRGRTIASTGGLFRVVLRTVHTDIETLAVSWQPYESGTGVIAPFPDPVPDTFDVWLLGASLERQSGAGNITNSVLKLTQVIQGFGIDDSAVAITSNAVFYLAFWDTIEGSFAPGFGNVPNNNFVWQHPGIRIPRKGAIASPFIVFEAISSATVSIDCTLLVGLFPVALGQDGLI